MMPPIRIAILGVAHHHIDAYLAALATDEQVECVGLYERDAALAATYSKRHGIRAFGDRAELLAQRPDGAIVCSTNAEHSDDIAAAATQTLPILCEKPLAATLDQCLRQRDCLQQDYLQQDYLHRDYLQRARPQQARPQNTNAFLMPAHPMRFSASINQVARQIASGAVGKLLGGSATNQGQMPINHRQWFIDPLQAGGGAIIDHTAHIVDILRLLTASEITSVIALANSHLQPMRTTVETAALLLLRLANGSAFSLDCSWSRPQSFPTWGGLTLRLFCETAILEVDPFAQYSDLYGDPTTHHRQLPWGEDAIAAMIAEFVDCVRSRRRPRVDFSDGLAVQRVIDAAYRSLREGKEIAIPQ